MTEHTPVMQQYLDMKKEYDDAVLFFRMGDFYEMFFEDAKLAARELGLTLTTRDKNKKNPIPMAGVPYHAVNGYLTKLLRAGYKVAICEQTSLPGAARGPVKREVLQVVTPGTVLGDDILEAGANNFLAAVSLDGNATGIAVVDLSTGEFRAGELPAGRDWLDELERIGPAEVLMSEDEPPEATAALAGRLARVMITRREGWTFDHTFGADRIREHFKVAGLKGFGIEDSRPAIAAAGGALAYLIETQKSALVHITAIARYRSTDTMFLDARTLRNLEVTAPIMEGAARAHTLIGVLDRTRTPMGSRLLRRWLTAPLLDPAAIGERLDGVEELVGADAVRDKLGGLLERIRDVERLITRVCLERANPRDLVALAESLAGSWEVRELAAGASSAVIHGCTERIGDLRDLARRIEEAIVDEPPAIIAEGGVFRDGVNAELDELRSLSKSGRRYIAELQETERRRTGIQTLKIKYNNVFGYFIEVSKSQLDRVPEDYHRKQTLVNAERFITPELKEYEAKVLGAGERIADLERGLFAELRKDVAARVREVQAFSQAVALLDVLRAFAETARTRGYVRPVVDDGPMLHIREGRHPVVEDLLPAGKFVSNDTCLHTGTDQILIITGPNMAGKSTYLRQVGIITLMAQAGSFVPAAATHIGIVDRIFTRVGASDNLAGGESTFLVEMNETANILNNCTERSLILFDEVGRGTSTFDGLSIAWAIMEYLHAEQKSAARTLFATHFHELTELASLLPRVKNYNVAVKEWNDEIIFLRRIMEGGSDQSLGIQVARLAGLPAAVIDRAKEILAALQANEFTINDTPRIAIQAKRNAPAPPKEQISLFTLPDHPVVQELRDMDIDNLTPLKALMLLDRLKRMASE